MRSAPGGRDARWEMTLPQAPPHVKQKPSEFAAAPRKMPLETPPPEARPVPQSLSCLLGHRWPAPDKITGALVDRQPFGGFKISGIGSKAGGPDYLLQFVQPRTITENTLRRGFAPNAGE